MYDATVERFPESKNSPFRHVYSMQSISFENGTALSGMRLVSARPFSGTTASLSMASFLR